MKKIIFSFICGLLTLSLYHAAASAATENQTRYGRTNRGAMSISRIDTARKIIVIGDLSYVYDSSLRVHTSLTNFGTIRSLKIGDRVTFRLQPTKDGSLVTEIWVTSNTNTAR
jgi:hypothetical protein